MSGDPQKPDPQDPGPQKPVPAAKGGNWGDLQTRVVSGVILALLGLGLLLSKGLWLALGVSVLVGLMMWELARMTAAGGPGAGDRRHPLLVGAASGGAMLASLLLPGCWGVVLIALPILIGWRGTEPRHRIPFLLFSLGIFGAGYGLVVTRESFGLGTVIWLVGIIVASDVLGYFAGRAFGGPKFWPSISPKKTWSGTVAGWVGAFLLSLVFLLVTGSQDWAVLLTGPIIAFAGQMGDIAESWLKRRVGVKDSSDLIPGHGGVMDRFDAMSGAFLVALILWLLLSLLPSLAIS